MIISMESPRKSITLLVKEEEGFKLYTISYSPNTGWYYSYLPNCNLIGPFDTVGEVIIDIEDGPFEIFSGG